MYIHMHSRLDHAPMGCRLPGRMERVARIGAPAPGHSILPRLGNVSDGSAVTDASCIVESQLPPQKVPLTSSEIDG